MTKLTPIVEKLLFINIVLFLAHKFLGFNLIDLFGFRFLFSEHFRTYQLFTHLFMHASFLHLCSNMFSLVSFGPILEQTLSSKRFLLFYLVAGVGAALLYSLVGYVQLSKLSTLYHAYMVHPTPEGFTTFLNRFPQHLYKSSYEFGYHFFDHPDNQAYIVESKVIIDKLYRLKTDMPTVGASGAIFGILTAFSMLFPYAQVSLFLLPIPIKAKYFIVLYGLYELWAGIETRPADQVAHFAHLGGILFGYLFIKLWQWHQK
jgi:membrane associated rhomboid family serine protease